VGAENCLFSGGFTTSANIFKTKQSTDKKELFLNYTNSPVRSLKIWQTLTRKRLRLRCVFVPPSASYARRAGSHHIATDPRWYRPHVRFNFAITSLHQKTTAKTTGLVLTLSGIPNDGFKV